MSQTDSDYEALLQKAHDALPENVGNKERWSLPPPDVIKEGRMTILRNFREMVNAVRREDKHLAKYLLTQLATAGQMDGDRMVFTGNVTASSVQSRLDDYVATYVQCLECGSPDTALTRDGRVQLLRCEACGAHTPVKARKGTRKVSAGQQVREGSLVEVEITRTGSKGQGMGDLDGYTIVVPGVAQGATARVRITRITGQIAVGEPEQ